MHILLLQIHLNHNCRFLSANRFFDLSIFTDICHSLHGIRCAKHNSAFCKNAEMFIKSICNGNTGVFKSEVTSFIEKKIKEQSQVIHSIDGHISDKYGFLPSEEPIQQFEKNSDYEIWDVYIKKLPQWIEDLSIIHRIEHELPILSASTTALPDKYLLRSALVLKSLAHAYFYTFTKTNNCDSKQVNLPNSIKKPWHEITTRLGRKYPGRNVTDDFLYNWCLKKSDKGREYDNLEILVPYFFVSAERRMVRIVLAMEGTFGPVIGYIGKIYDGIFQKNNTLLSAAIKEIIKTLGDVIQQLSRMNLNECNIDFIDPVFWGRSFGKISVGWYEHEKGNSGAQLPMFHVLDALIGRNVYEGEAAREIISHFSNLPKSHQEFINLIKNTKPSLKEYISDSQNKELKCLYRNLLEMYIGQYGILSIHRHKIIAAITLTIFDTRSFTNNTLNLVGLKKLHLHINEKLKLGITNRWDSQPISYKKWNKLEIKSIDTNIVTLKIATNLLPAYPGDCVEILPEQDIHIVDNILARLNLDFNQLIFLNQRWVNALNLRYKQRETQIKLGIFLRYIEMNSLKKTFVDKFEKLSQIYLTSQITFLEILDQHDDYKHALRKLFLKEDLSELFDPLAARVFSIANITDNCIEILVDNIEKTSAIDNQKIVGTASSQLLNIRNIKSKIPFRIKPIFKFHPPKDKSVPAILFASGSGISPFIHFITRGALEKCILIISCRTDNPPYFNKLHDYVLNNKLSLYILNTQWQCKSKLIFFANQQYKEIYYEKHHRIEKLFDEIDFTKTLRNLIFNELAYIYVCGNSGFSRSIKQEILKLLPEKNKNFNDMFFFNRYHENVYDTQVNEKCLKKFSATAIKKYNKESNGFYIIINCKVYQLADYKLQHPGGAKILQLYAGLDASDVFNETHSEQPEVANELNRMLIGIVEPFVINSKMQSLYIILDMFAQELTSLENIGINGLKFYDEEISILINNQTLSNVLNKFTKLISTINTKILCDTCQNNSILYPIVQMAYIFENLFGSNEYKKLLTLASKLELPDPNITAIGQIELHNTITQHFLDKIYEIKLLIVNLCLAIEKNTNSELIFTISNEILFDITKHINAIKFLYQLYETGEYYMLKTGKSLNSLKMLENAGIEFKLITLDQLPKSSSDIVRLFKCDLKQVIKTLLFINNRNENFLVSLCGDDKVDFLKLKKLTNSDEIYMAKSENSIKLIGLPLGGVTLFLDDEFKNNITAIFVDERILENAKINIGSGKPEIGIELSIHDFKKILNTIELTFTCLRQIKSSKNLDNTLEKQNSNFIKK